MLKLSSLKEGCTFDAQKICGFYGPTSENELADASPFCEWEAFVQKIPHLCRTHDDEELRSLISNVILTAFVYHASCQPHRITILTV